MVHILMIVIPWSGLDHWLFWHQADNFGEDLTDALVARALSRDGHTLDPAMDVLTRFNYQLVRLIAGLIRISTLVHGHLLIVQQIRPGRLEQLASLDHALGEDRRTFRLVADSGSDSVTLRAKQRSDIIVLHQATAMEMAIDGASFLGGSRITNRTAVIKHNLVRLCVNHTVHIGWLRNRAFGHIAPYLTPNVAFINPCIFLLGLISIILVITAILSHFGYFTLRFRFKHFSLQINRSYLDIQLIYPVKRLLL